MAILEAVHYFSTIAIFTISSLDILSTTYSS